MKTNMKKFLSLLLAFSMVLSLMSISVFADSSSSVKYYDDDGTELVGSEAPDDKVVDGYKYTFDKWVPTAYEALYEKGPFEPVFPNVDSYLYRVGNKNTVKLSSLFKLEDGVNVDGSKVRVAVKPEKNATVTLDSADWKNGTIQFQNEGPVEVTIFEEGGIGTMLPLEVVSAWNVTAYGELKHNENNVLLNDITMADGDKFHLFEASLYGNGFTFDVRNGSISSKDNSSSYLIFLRNGTLDNVYVTGSVYTTYPYSVSQDYANATVLTDGNSVIANSFISNCASPVRALRGTLRVVNTTVKGGLFANIDVHNAYVSLDGVTTINQANSNEGATDGTIPVGLGIVVNPESVTDARIEINGDLWQYNYVSEDMKFKNSYAAAFHNEIFSNDAYTHYLTDKDGVRYANTGIIAATPLSETVTISDNRAEKGSYHGQTVRFCGVDGYVYAPEADDPVVPGSYHADNQNPVVPDVTVNKDGDIYTGDTLLVTFERGQSYVWDANRVTVTKSGHPLDVSISVSGTEGAYSFNSDAKTITFSNDGEFVVTYSYSDSDNYRLAADGTTEQYTEEYTKRIPVVARTTAGKPKVEYVGYNTKEYQIGEKTFLIVAEDATTNVWTKDNNIDKIYETVTIDGAEQQVVINYPVLEKVATSSTGTFKIFDNFIRIEDDGTVYDGNTSTKPDNLNIVWGQCSGDSKNVGKQDVGKDKQGNHIVYTGTNTYKDVFNYSRGTKATTQIGNSGGKAAYTIDIGGATRGSYYFVVKYAYVSGGYTFYYYVGYKNEVSNSGGNGGGGSTCVTEDTLITLADWSQVPVKDLTGNEDLLVWNLETGSYDSAPVVFVDSDPTDEYSIVHAWFDDGTDVEIISEHGFFDLKLGKYVYLEAESSEDYIGHPFVKQANDGWSVAKLNDVTFETRVATPYSPVTFGHLCYYVNGMLSMPGGIPGLFNIFNVDTTSMSYDVANKAADLDTYGRLSLEDYGEMIPEVAYEAFNGAYLGVSMAKGLLSWGDIEYLAARYMPMVDAFDFEQMTEETGFEAVEVPEENAFDEVALETVELKESESEKVAEENAITGDAVTEEIDAANESVTEPEEELLSTVTSKLIFESAPPRSVENETTYSIKFWVDGEQWDSCNWNYAAATANSPAFPTAPQKVGYCFVEWKPIAYTAHYTKSLTSYSISFVDSDGTLLQSLKTDYGTIPAPNAPAKAGYTFTGWNPALTKVTEPATYTAQFVQNSTQPVTNDNGSTTTTVVEDGKTTTTTEGVFEAIGEGEQQKVDTVATTETTTDAGTGTTTKTETLEQTTTTEKVAGATLTVTVETTTVTTTTSTPAEGDATVNSSSETETNITTVTLKKADTSTVATSEQVDVDDETVSTLINAAQTNEVTTEQVKVEDVAKEVLAAVQEQKADEITGKNVTVTVTLTLEPTLTEVKTDDETTTVTGLTFDVKPMMQAKVQIGDGEAQNFGEKEAVDNAKLSATEEAPITVKLPITSDFGSNADKVQVKHTSTDENGLASIEYREGTIVVDGEKYYVTFTVTHFSSFEIVPKDKVFVTFDPGYTGGTKTEQTYSVGDTIVVPTVTRSGYTFAGWNTIVPETATKSATYTAQWNAIVYDDDDPAPTTTITDEETPLSAFPIFYVDVAEDSWYHDAIAYVTALDLMNGVGDDRFDPNANTTRGMVAVVMMRLAQGVAIDSESFFDVADDAYYAEAAAWAVENGVYVGYDDGSFRGELNILREQFAAVLYRYATAKGYDVSGKAELGSFTDSASVSGYAADAMAWAVESGIIEGVGDNLLDPLGNATRAQLATMLMRFHALYTAEV